MMAHYDDYFDIHEIETPWQIDRYEDGDFFAARLDTGVDIVHRRMIFFIAVVLLIGWLLLGIKPKATSASLGAVDLPAALQANSQNSEEGSVAASEIAAQRAASEGIGGLAPVFAPEVMYWESKILEWSQLYGVDPNMAAIIMQVESCGDPKAVSGAGAMSLFQVMPFHFQPGEDGFDPDTNAMRGLKYFADRLVQTGGDVGRAFAGYNGGHVAAGGNWDNWANETQRYFIWTTGLYEDIQAGNTESPTLQRWLEAGGAGLCRQAAQRLGLVVP